VGRSAAEETQSEPNPCSGTSPSSSPARPSTRHLQGPASWSPSAAGSPARKC